MECEYCCGDTKKTIVTYTGQVENCVFVIKNILAEKCEQCGEEFYDEDETELICKIANTVSEIPLELAVTDAKKWK